MKNAKRVTSILIITSMVITMFVGCSSKSASTSVQATQTGNKNFDPIAMKTLYSNVLKPLVTAKTITQSQSDKILAAETKNVQRSSGTGRPAGTATPSNTNRQNGTNGTNRRNGKNAMSNKLSTLVSSKVITLAQSNTVNQKIQEAMKNSQSSKSTQN